MVRAAIRADGVQHARIGNDEEPSGAGPEGFVGFPGNHRPDPGGVAHGHGKGKGACGHAPYFRSIVASRLRSRRYRSEIMVISVSNSLSFTSSRVGTRPAPARLAQT